MKQESIGKDAIKLTRYQIFVTAILAILQFTVVIDFAIISPLGDMLMKELNIVTSEFGLLVSSYAFGAGIAGLLAASFADKFDRKNFLLFFYAGFILGTLLCGLANNYTLLLIARSITGLFGGVISSISMSIASDLFTLNQRGRVIGYIQMAFSGSQILGIPIGLLIANTFGWNSTFIAIVLISTIVFLALIFKLRPIKDHLNLQTGEKLLTRSWRVLSDKNYLLGFILIAMVAMGGAMLMPFSAVFLINNVDLTQDQLPLLFICTGMATIIIMPIVGKLSDRIDKFKIFTIGSFASILMTIIYTNLTPIPLWMVIVINIAMFAGISSRMVPAMALNTAVPDKKDRGTYMSLCTTLQQTSNGLGALLAGFIVVQHTKNSPLEHFNTLGYVVVTMSLICIYLIFCINKRVNIKNSLLKG